ncbi:MAG: oligosaccharide flippase family protein, partial [Candidatus Competibacteraceae bacterium]|nr:oligosaccharide flippase family protein [Candidatus Competibacteraceae bacterium]
MTWAVCAGGFDTAVGQAAIFGVRLLGTIVLARMLTPIDFGVVNMVVVGIGFAQIFQDLGLSAATVQSRNVTHQQVSYFVLAGSRHRFRILAHRRR